MPNADDLEPRVGVSEFAGTQPYHLALIGEKSSLDAVLGPIAKRYQPDLYLPTGDISNTMIYTLAKTSEIDGRPLVVLYFSDCDTSGWNMPITVARKLLTWKRQQFPQLNFRCHRAGLRPDQVRQHDLPISPGKESDPRGVAWEAKMGVQQTEIDAIATLPAVAAADRRGRDRPVLRPHFDRAGRADETAWRERAQQPLDEQTGDLE